MKNRIFEGILSYWVMMSRIYRMNWDINKSFETPVRILNKKSNVIAV